MHLWTVSDARGIELETPKLLLMFRLSSICVPNFTTFYHRLLWAAINSRAKKKKNRSLHSSHLFSITGLLIIPTCYRLPHYELYLNTTSPYSGVYFYLYWVSKRLTCRIFLLLPATCKIERWFLSIKLQISLPCCLHFSLVLASDVYLHRVYPFCLFFIPCYRRPDHDGFKRSCLIQSSWYWWTSSTMSTNTHSPNMHW